MEFENLIKISSMVNAIYCNIQEKTCEEVGNDIGMSEQIGKWADNLQSINKIFD